MGFDFGGMIRLYDIDVAHRVPVPFDEGHKQRETVDQKEKIVEGTNVKPEQIERELGKIHIAHIVSAEPTDRMRALVREL